MHIFLDLFVPVVFYDGFDKLFRSQGPVLAFLGFEVAFLFSDTIVYDVIPDDYVTRIS